MVGLRGEGMISCNQYDYIEIACMHRCPIVLTMKSGENLVCVALDTQVDEAHRECIKVSAEGVERLVVLDEIAELEVSVENPHFKHVSFG